AVEHHGQGREVLGQAGQRHEGRHGAGQDVQGGPDEVQDRPGPRARYAPVLRTKEMLYQDMEPHRRQLGGQGRAGWFSAHAFHLPLLCGCLAASLPLFCLPRARAAPLPVIRTAPPFALTTQDGKPLELADLRGKVVLVSFIFTTCNGSCPATTARL